MNSIVVLLLIVAVAIVAAKKLGLLGKGRGGQGAERWPVFPKRVLTPVEQQLYRRLVRAFPEHVVLSQVALSQFVGVRKGEDFRAISNRYNRLVADFVLCHPRDFSIAAVIELDDRSHDHPARQDADRRKTAVCKAAGIPLHRLDVNPLPNEADLPTLLGLGVVAAPPSPPMAQARVFSLGDRRS